jgi:hypothetical protein
MVRRAALRVNRVHPGRGSGKKNDQGINSERSAERWVGEGKEGGDEREPAGGRLAGEESQARK